MTFIHPHKVFIEKQLSKEFQPIYLEVIDESYMHASGPEAGSHYKVVMASTKFIDLNLVQRQRLVFRNLMELLPAKIHALSLKLYTPAEWHESPEVFASPKCLGKNTDFIK